MILVGSGQQGLARHLVLPPLQHRVFLAQPVQRRREPDVVLAIARGNGQRGIARRIVRVGGAVGDAALARQHHARLRLVQPGDGDHLASAGARLLQGPLSLHGEQRAAAHAPVAKDQFVPFLQRPAMDPGIGQPPDGAALRNLEHVDAVLRADPPRGLPATGGFVPQQLEQPAHPAAGQRRGEHHRHEATARGILGKVAHHRCHVRHFVHQQGLEQVVVEIGQRFEQPATVRALQHGDVGGDFDRAGGGARPVAVGPLERQIDIADHALALADGNLAQRQRFAAERLQVGDQFMDGADARGVDTVDDDGVRHAERVQTPQDRLGQPRALGQRIDHDQREVGRLQRLVAVGDEARCAGQVDQGEAIPRRGDMRQVDLRRTAARTRHGAGIADSGAGGHRTGAIDGAAGMKQRFGKARLAGARRPDQRDRARARRRRVDKTASVRMRVWPWFRAG